MTSYVPNTVERDLNLITRAWFDLFDGDKPTELQMVIWVKAYREKERRYNEAKKLRDINKQKQIL